MPLSRPLFSLPLLLLCLLFSPAARAQKPAPSPTPNLEIEQFAAALLAAPNPSAENDLLAARKNLITPELEKTLINIGDEAIKESEFKNGDAAFTLALKIGEMIGDKATTALALRSSGDANRYQGNFTIALQRFNRALAIYEQAADESGIAQSLNGIGIAQTSLGNYEAAAAAFRRNLEINEKLGNKAGAAGAYSSLNIVFQYLGDFDGALNYGRRALAIAREIDNKAFIGMALSNISLVHESRGDFRAALEARQEALSLFEEAGNKTRIALTLNNIGGTYLAQGDLPTAENYFSRSLIIREQIGDKDGIARAALRLGEVKSRQNDYPAALTFFNRSIRLREEAADPSALAETLAAVGKVYFKQGEYAKASENMTRGLQLAESIKERETTANILVALARVYLAQNKFEIARSHATRAIALATEMNLRETLLEAHTVAGEIALATNDANLARASFERAIKTIEESRLLIAGGEQDRQQFFESKTAPYHRLIEIAVRENRFAEAFAVAERAKARVLLDVLQSGRGQLNKSLSAAEQAQETKLRAAIYSLNSQLQKEISRADSEAARTGDLRGQIIKARADYDAFTAALYAAHPELKLQRGEAQIVSAAEMNSLLPNNESALAEYVVTEKQTYLFVATKAKTAAPDLRVYPLDLTRQELNQAVTNFRAALARRDIRFNAEAGKLYRKLVAPAAAQIGEKTRLTIVPDGALWELPFQALVAEDGKYVVENYAVSYAPSASVLIALERGRRERKIIASGDLLAFGNPSLPMNGFADLPETEKQVKALSALYQAKRSRVLVGELAAESEFKREAANYRVIHLATHGVLDDASALYSYVLLSRGAKADASGEDGMLQAWELMQMNLNADFVVLSACETARGTVRSGEGIIGLSWALFVAGTPTTVASQWKVESASTTELMLGFYRNLQIVSAAKKPTKAEALRRASLALLRNEKYAHPFYWAGFVIVGDGE